MTARGEYPALSFFTPLSSSNDEEVWFSIYLASAIESCFFLVVYLILASCVLYKIKCNLPMDAYFTLFIFLSCSTANLTCFILELRVENNDVVKRSLIEIPTIVASGLITSVLFWYTYQIKVVLLKITSESPKIMFEKIY